MRGSIVAPEGLIVFNHSHQLEFADESSKIILILQLLQLDTLFFSFTLSAFFAKGVNVFYKTDFSDLRQHQLPRWGRHISTFS